MLSDHLGEGLGGPAAASSMGALIALAGAASSAVAMIQTRRLTRSEPTGAIVFYFSSVTTAISAVLLVVAALWPAELPGAAFLAGQRFAAPSAGEFALLAAIGVLGGGGQIFLTQGYQFADASVIAAFDYVAMIWAAALGYGLFAETPSPLILCGAAIVAAAGVFVLWREHLQRRIRRTAAAAALNEAARRA
jgi:drug/metabolite transporter (DMT)-like permease